MTSPRATRRFAIAGQAGFVILALVLVLGLISPTTGEALPWRNKPYKKGQVVVISGQVTTPDGQALPGVTVLLAASRNSFRVLKMSREKGDALQMPSIAGADGRYRFDLRWDPHHNFFELVVVLPVRSAGRDSYEEFHRQDITDRLMQGVGVEYPLVVPSTEALEELRAFLASLKSDDEKRVYQEMGRPDRIDQGKAHYDPDRSWWYFAAGKVYHFRQGKIEQEVSFEPVSAETG